MNPAHKSWQRWEIDFVAEAYPDREWSVSAIAKKLGCSSSSVNNIANRIGVRRPGYKLDHARIVALREEGLSFGGIAAALDCSKGGVQRVLKVQGVA